MSRITEQRIAEYERSFRDPQYYYTDDLEVLTVRAIARESICALGCFIVGAVICIFAMCIVGAF